MATLIAQSSARSSPSRARPRTRSAASTRSRCSPTRPSRRSAQAIEKLFGVKVTGVWTSNQRGKTRRVGQTVGRRPHWKKAIVKLREGDTIDDLRGLSGHGHSSIQAGDQGHAFPLGLRFRRDHARRRRRSRWSSRSRSRRPRQPRPHLDAPHRRWPQAQVPHHRLQAQQARHAGDGAARSSTIRTARRASRWSSTRTARSATSCTRRG